MNTEKNQSLGYQQLLLLAVSFMLTLPTNGHEHATISESWVLVDNFENQDLSTWEKRDTKNDTNPKIENPQVTEIRKETSGNHYLIKKPAAEGIVGNRKALSFTKLPRSVEVGETYTFYTRINVEYFPNNHVFGLSNLDPQGIAENDYNAFEPSLRITDKAESSGLKNDGTLMVKLGKGYAKIENFEQGRKAKPLEESRWYEVWYVVNNATVANGGQIYDVYVRGGEFDEQRLVYQGADFRMKRERPLIYFLTNCNTGPKDHPYGNGGILYDDIYMVKGLNLSAPR